MVRPLIAIAVALCIISVIPLAAQAPPAPKPSPIPGILLPPEVQAVVGHEVNVYFANLVLALTLDDYTFDVTCAKGTQQQERWTFVPKPEDVGVHDLRIDLRDGTNAVVASAATKLRVIAADAGAGSAISALIIGDSLTHASVYPEELLTLCKAPGNPQLTLIGTHHLEGTSPENRHEGYGGWTAARFATFFDPKATAPGQSSPFLYAVGDAPTLDFQRYVTENAAGRPPDIITIMLGCNDNFGATDETIEASITTMFGHLDTLIKEFRRVGPQTKIALVLLPPPAATQDAFGANYNCGQTRWQYRRNQQRVVERTLTAYGSREAEGLYLIPDYVNLDSVHNYPTTTGPANSRTNEKITRQANGVHPNADGYRQIADSIYYWLKGVL